MVASFLAVSQKLMSLNQLTEEGKKKRWYLLNHLQSMLSVSLVLHCTSILVYYRKLSAFLKWQLFKKFNFAGNMEKVSMCTRHG